MPPPSLPRMLPLIAIAIFFESLFFSALSPLLPGLTREFDLSAVGAGALVAIDAFGLVLMLLPSALLATAFGAKRTAVVGLVIMSLATASFGLADSYATLMATRFLQGAGAAGLWVGGLAWLVQLGPVTRRGRMIGIVLAGLAAGEIAGPAVGAVAAEQGRSGTFVAVAVLLAVLTFWAVWAAGADGAPGRLDMRSALAARGVRGVLALCAVPAAVSGVLSVLAPLELDELGATPAGIAAAWVCAATLGVLVQPVVGAWSDRHGRHQPIRLGLVVAVPALPLLGLAHGAWLAAALLVVVLLALSAAWGPVMTELLALAEAAGASHVTGITLAQVAGTIGFLLGSSVAGALGPLDWVAGYTTVAVAVAVVWMSARGALPSAGGTGKAIERHVAARRVSL